MKNYQILAIRVLGGVGKINPISIVYCVVDDNINDTVALKIGLAFDNKKEFDLFVEKLNNWKEHFLRIGVGKEGDNFILTNDGQEVRVLSGMKDYVLNFSL
jgi:hypothetical protein